MENVTVGNISQLFTKQICHYNPEKDVSPVEQGDIFDLASAFVNGMIPENIVVPDSDYDNNEEPASIVGRPANEFEAIHLMETLKQVSSGKQSSDKTEDSSSS